MKLPLSVFGVVVVVGEAIAAPGADDESLLQTVSRSRQVPGDVTIGTSITVEDPYTTPPGCLSGPTPVVSTSCQYAEDAPQTRGPRDHKGCQICHCAGWISVDGFTTTNGVETCRGQIRNRKEISDVTDDEFDLFAAAVNTLKAHGDWDAVTRIHMTVEGEAHNNNRFGHWHRKYLYDMETLIQAAANRCDVTLPYWNWALDVGAASTTNPAVWGPNRYGSLDHAGDPCGFQLCPDPARCPGARGPGSPGFPGNLPREPGFFDTCVDENGEPIMVPNQDGELVTVSMAFTGSDTDPGSETATVQPPADPQRCPWMGGFAVQDGKFGAGTPFGQGEENGNPFLSGFASFSHIYRCKMGGPVNSQDLGLLNSQLEQHMSELGVAGEFLRNESSPGRGEQVQYMGFIQFLEQLWHNSQHCAVGGIMCGFASPYDPVFWAHHSFVDKIWKDWQDANHDVVATDSEWGSVANGKLDQLPMLICNNADANSDMSVGIDASDVEISTHMTGTMNGAVDYWERASFPTDCENEEHTWEEIQCCMSVVTAEGQWHNVKRVAVPEAERDISDTCVPQDTNTQAHQFMWLTTMRDLGFITQSVLEDEMTFTTDSFTQASDNSKIAHTLQGLTACEKRLCLTISSGGADNLLGVCQSSEAGQTCFA